MKNIISKSHQSVFIYLAAVIYGATCSSASFAQNDEGAHQHNHGEIEEIIVSGSQGKSKTETALPVHLINGEELRNSASTTLGETIQNQVGVHSSSFGVGVGQPVIRGLTGNRVKVLQNNLSTLDASSASQDHADSVEALLSEQIEIVRGPATLLYGNGAIGGIVNVIDNRIPKTLAPSAFGGATEIRHSSVNDNNTLVTKLGGSIEKISWYFDGVHRDSNFVEIPGYALDIESIEALEHHDEDEMEEEEEHENTKGFVANSDTEAENFTIGGSWIGDDSYFGIAFSNLKNNYGIPPGAHHHEEGEEEEEEGEENIRIDLEQQRSDIEFGQKYTGFIEELNAHLTFNDYEHKELEGPVVGTRFKNKGFDSRVTVKHQHHKGLNGVWGLQYGDRDFSAVGEESFIPAADISNLGFFILESIDLSPTIIELGLRVDKDKIKTKAACDTDTTSWSANAATIWGIDDNTNINVSLSRAERAPTVEELFSNIAVGTCDIHGDENLVTHAATQRIELGDPRLTTEVSNNIDIGFFKYTGNFRAEINFFRNNFKNFIYLADSGEIDETIVSQYLQDDASFQGAEVQLSYPRTFLDVHHFDFTIFGDRVKAELDSGENIPRIPPQRFGIELQYQVGDFSAKLRTTKVSAQKDVAKNELETEGYTRIDAQLDYHLQTQGLEWVFFAKASNLSDKEIRDHTSLLKNFSPAPGRSIDLGVRLSF
ncbi:TonB-dependent receptor [Aurantivibrio infirmus]